MCLVKNWKDNSSFFFRQKSTNKVLGTLFIKEWPFWRQKHRLRKVSEFAYFSEEVRVWLSLKSGKNYQLFFCRREQKKWKLPRKKGFYWQSKHTFKKVTKFGILSLRLVDGFRRKFEIFSFTLRQKKAKKKYLWPIQKKTFFIDNKPLYPLKTSIEQSQNF